MKNLTKFFVCSFLLITNLLYSVNPNWEQTEFIWNFSFIHISDVGQNMTPWQYFQGPPTFNKNIYKNIREGDIVWINSRFVKQFSEQVLPKVNHPFVLIINGDDESFPSNSGLGADIEDFISNKNIIHIFAQNNDYNGTSKKVSHLPIGIDFHTIGYRNGHWGEAGASPQEQENLLKEILQRLPPTYLREKRAFVDFYLNDTLRNGAYKRYLEFGEDRQTIFNRLIGTGLIDYLGKMKRSDMWEIKGYYAFSISPPGNGIDCHRTWEDLALGCIVIVKSTSLDPMFENLPVVMINDWSEITEENLEKWLQKYSDAFTNPFYREKLKNAYWVNKIQKKVNEYWAKKNGRI